ncbi:MAG TPA: energy transducer TonB, partial [Acidobacteriota bacterium]|nr:energy transducer TonB [Acidobacteriota bacterium]
VDAGSYGAFELKLAYQRNLTVGLILAVLTHLAILGGAALIGGYEGTAVGPVPPRPETSSGGVVFRPLPPPPPIIAEPTSRRISPGDIRGMIPDPVPDELATETVVFNPIREAAEIGGSYGPASSYDGSGNTSARAGGIVDTAEYLPSRTEFVYTDELPVPVKIVKPTYPEMARLTSREATVLVSALIDSRGTVREVVITRSSGSNVGFDDAARAAAYATRYKPAIQNGRPVAVWVTYPVRFRLHN